MRSIEKTITISASPDAVWSVLVDFENYRNWNPFVLWAEGRPVVGETLKAHIRPPGGKGMTHQPTVLIAEPGRHLQWLGKVAVPGLFSGRHEFILEPTDEGTLLRQREEFTGILVPFLGSTLDRTEKGFVELNQALKNRAEALAG
ncbi:SRPBCC family protein [Streptomyces rimosus]|uniref:SRPBCC domain-containing protein n=1 Tax=Streptomyces rimosus TaxID=1927 RepID=UPI0004C7F814|nr:SRPBCC domain-containing protein [Streptomyces rimosus]